MSRKESIIWQVSSFLIMIIIMLISFSFIKNDEKTEGAATKKELIRVDQELRRDGDIQFKTINETLVKKLDSDVFNTYVSSEKEANKKRDQQFETIDKRIYDMWTKEGFKE